MATTNTITMLAPRPSDGTGDLQPKATKAFASLAIVCAGAHAVRSCYLSPIATTESDNPDVQKQMKAVTAGIADLSTKLDLAKVTANTWINDLYPRIGSSIPRHILDYSATFDAASDQIMALLAEAKQNGSSPSLISQALDLTGALHDQVQSYMADLVQVAADLTAYGSKVQTDHDALVGGNDLILSLISVDKSEIEAFGSDIKALQDTIDALHKQLEDAAIGLGLSIFAMAIGVAVCFVPGGVGVGGALIAVGAAGVGTSGYFVGSAQQQIDHDRNQIADDQKNSDALTQQIKSLTALHMTVGKVIDQVTAAQLALSDVQVFWVTFEGTIKSVIDDLGKPNANLSLVLDEMWVSAAKNNWAVLKTFAENMVDAKIAYGTQEAA